jgi:hypothetical protein|tara:strand:+ start:45 stop:245 length:201 start_codon:yes stop_codon:yes gene_type:complete
MVDITHYGEVYGSSGGWLHRIDGPALTQSNGNVHWYLNGDLHTFDEWIKLTPISDEEKMLLRLQYG